jgi:hypothetical protein
VLDCWRTQHQFPRLHQSSEAATKSAADVPQIDLVARQKIDPILARLTSRRSPAVTTCDTHEWHGRHHEDDRDTLSAELSAVWHVSVHQRAVSLHHAPRPHRLTGMANLRKQRLGTTSLGCKLKSGQ